MSLLDDMALDLRHKAAVKVVETLDVNDRYTTLWHVIRPTPAVLDASLTQARLKLDQADAA